MIIIITIIKKRSIPRVVWTINLLFAALVVTTFRFKKKIVYICPRLQRDLCLFKEHYKMTKDCID